MKRHLPIRTHQIHLTARLIRRSLGALLGLSSAALLIASSAAEPTATPASTRSAVKADATLRAQVISPDQLERRQVGQGKAVIEIFKEGRAAFVGRLTLAPHAAVPQHRDPTEEYLIVESGSGVITLDGVKHTIKAGDVVYMPARAEVSFKNGPQTLRALQVFAGPESARKYDRWQVVPATPKPPETSR